MAGYAATQMSAGEERKRTLIFIVAYQAERHLASVLSRIPAELISNPEIEILVIDDGSTDHGVSVGRKWAEEHNATNITILRNPINQGYGGNQKLGYRMAIDAGFDYVILLHGDGQYAPELLPKFIEIRRQTDADVVLGSRMKDLRSAKRGGMPWYKLFGNRALTTFQNKVTGQNLSEYHTGYRAYSTSLLKRIPFEINTNDFHFDTEILLQSFHAKAKVEEFLIPTHYGDEICRVNGMRYAKDVVFSTLRFKMHQWGMLCDLRYRQESVQNYDATHYMVYSSNVIAQRLLKEANPQPHRILDIICTPGFFAQACRRDGMYVVGMDKERPADGSVDEFRPYSPEADPTPADAFEFDAILLLRVLERLTDPERFLVELRNASRVSSPSQRLPLVVVSTPNVGFAAVRLNLLLGRFNYAQRGILDIRHKRLFTRRALVRTLQDAGYAVLKVHPAAVPFKAVVGGTFGAVMEAISGVLAKLWPSMFAFQFVVECRPKAGVKQLIGMAERHNTVSPAFAEMLEAEEVRC